MPRRTSLPAALKVVGEREVEDERTVEEAFPRHPADEASENSTLNEDILAILRRSHERVETVASEANAVAAQAIDRANAALERVTGAEGAIATRAAEAEKGMAAVAERALTEIRAVNRRDQATAAAMAVSSGMLKAFGDRLAAFGTLVLDRAAPLMSLGAGIWLTNKILPSPAPLQLAGLALYGLVVIAPAMWFSRRG